jgi:transposase-like protein
MQIGCPECDKDSEKTQARAKIVRFGSYYRTSDGRWIQRFRCMGCKKNFSAATFHPCYRQKKRHKNEILRRLFSSLISQRRAARTLKLNRTTVTRKFLFLSARGELSFHLKNCEAPKAQEIEFDDMESFEHTKCKPLSITLAVEAKTRRILGIEVSAMKAKGLLVKKAKKYGKRRDGRTEARRRLFEKIRPLMADDCLIKSDMNPHYEKDVREFFPRSRYRRFKGQRGSLSGQGELKKVRFDPLFSLNHTCAMLRANVNRLLRKTWCTTKRADRLRAHLMLYADYHNSQLIEN